MPKRTDIKSILIIGAGPIVIGQACEFDYSGAQACKALREEGYRVILVNSNPATIMTDPDMADVTYIEPIHWRVVEQIIERERPDALLPTMGGQTALNCALDLAREGVLEKFGVEMIGARKEAIDKAEDREKFKQAMSRIGLITPRSAIAHSLEEALQVQASIGFPAIIRPSFTMGGSGGGIAYNHQEFIDICERGLEASPTRELLVEESVIGWKEFEMEVVRDHADNAIIICSIENFDAMGVHTGDSITVAPAQTLTDKEYQMMRSASLAVLREIGVETGGANVQFAINPLDGKMIVIEMNPRVSRSSALASKATGFPIAKVAAKLAVGFTLDELVNEMTGGKTPASFEPSIDYVVTKIPRFAFEKFPEADDRLTTQMKSVGEVMAIGRTFQESLQKAMRGLEIGSCGFDSLSRDFSEITTELADPGPERLWYLGDAFRQGLSLMEIHRLSKIDPWFLAEIQDLILTEKELLGISITSLTETEWRTIKSRGFSDRRLGQLWGVSETEVRSVRHQMGVRPAYKRVDSCAGEFATSTAYLYSTYEEECEALPTKNKKIMVLGGGPNRIGQGIEFDYCCVHAAMALREDGYETLMVNCNPETVSTDYDSSDRLYFEPLTLEDVLEIVFVENPQGVIVQFGGQTPLKLSKGLEKAGVPIIGTSSDSIDLAEDRQRFQKFLHDIALCQPENRTASSRHEVMACAETLGFPIVVRPSYVLGGRAMQVVHSSVDLEKYLRDVVTDQDGMSGIVIRPDSPLLLDRFLNDATEVDVDAVCDGNQVILGGIMEHIEQAGVHSGDSACSLPPFSLSVSIQNELRRQTILMAINLGVIGLINIQFAIQGEKVYVLEVNPRASRTIPYVAKATGRPLAKIAARCMVGETLAQQGIFSEVIPTYYAVKEAVFPFMKFPGVDPILGPEMKSTGEVMGIGHTFAEAFYKSQLAAGVRFPTSGRVFISVRNADKDPIVELARGLYELGFSLVATQGTHAVLVEAGLSVQLVNKVKEGRPHVVDMIKNQEIDFIINTVEDNARAVWDSRSIRHAAVQSRITYYTTLAGARAACMGLQVAHSLSIQSIQSLHL